MKARLVATLLFAGLVIGATASPIMAQPDAIAAIQLRRERCKETPAFWFAGDPAAWMPGPRELMECDWTAIDDANVLSARSAGNPLFKALLLDLSAPLGLAMTGGEHALAFSVTAIYMEADFALRRADILTADGPGAVAGDTLLANPFSLLSSDPEIDVIALHRRWVAIRDADCAAYPVSDCAARLDEALAGLLIDATAPPSEG